MYLLGNKRGINPQATRKESSRKFEGRKPKTFDELFQSVRWVPVYAAGKFAYSWFSRQVDWKFLYPSRLSDFCIEGTKMCFFWIESDPNCQKNIDLAAERK